MEHNKARMVVAANLRRIRLEKGMTQEELDEAAGLKPGTIATIEGSVYDVEVDELGNVGEALEFDLQDLFIDENGDEV